MKSKRTVAKPCHECAVLKSVIHDIWWMARRYADKRMTYAPGMFNEAMDKCVRRGMEFRIDNTADPPSIYADDGQFGKWKDGRFVVGICNK